MNLPVIRCRHCGAALAQVPADMPEELRALLHRMRGATVRASILRTLAHRFGEEVPHETLIVGIYGNRLDGGPLTADNTLSVHCSGLRRVLKPIGFTIIGRRFPSTYQLVPVDAVPACDLRIRGK